MQPCLPPSAGIRQVLIVVLDVHLNGRADLLHVRKAARRARLFAGLGEDREKNRGQDGDDSNDDEKLDQGEGCGPNWPSTTSLHADLLMIAVGSMIYATVQRPGAFF